MRVLTVRQPWAWAIVHGGKDVENRVRNVAGGYRGPVAIHAALQLDRGGFEHDVLGPMMRDRWGATWVNYSGGWLGEGRIIGVVDLVDVHHCFNALTKFEGCSPWAEIDAWHLVLENPRPLAEPILFRGALGLRTLPADVEAAVLAGVVS